MVTLLVFLIVGAARVESMEARYDAMFWAIQWGLAAIILVATVMYGAGNEKTLTMLFGGFMLAAAPSIASICVAHHTWLEKKMINYLTTTYMYIFAFSCISDILSVFWARAEKNKTKFFHMHMFILLIMLYSVFTTATTNLPGEPPKHPLKGTFLSVITTYFLLVFTLSPTIMIQFMRTETMHLVMFKETVELALRVIFFIVMAYIYANGVYAA
jgi:hypothetical protein